MSGLHAAGVRVAMVAAGWLVASALGGCKDERGPTTGPGLEPPWSAPGALANGVSFSGAALIRAELPEPSTQAVTLVPLVSVVELAPFATALMPLSVEPPEARASVVATLIQFEGHEQHLRVPAPSPGDEATIDNSLEVSADVCSRLCNTVHTVRALQALELDDARVTEAVAVEVRLDCRDDGDPRYCDDAGASLLPVEAGPGDAGLDGAVAMSFPRTRGQSCEAAPNCGVGGSSVSCCEGSSVPATSYLQGPDGSGTTRNASVGAVELDRFEVSVGRFRAFVAAYADGFRPQVGEGAHPRIAGSGWQASWGAALPADGEALQRALDCDSRFAHFSPDGLADAQLPINCVDFPTALAFCIWDGGRLPTEAEWERAARADDGRTYPWGDAPIDVTRAVHNCLAGDEPACTFSRVLRVPVGDRPAGQGAFGQLDLSGSLAEWTLDAFGPYANADCDDCASLDQSTPRVLRGGSWLDADPARLSASARDSAPLTARRTHIGLRCAYDP